MEDGGEVWGLHISQVRKPDRWNHSSKVTQLRGNRACEKSGSSDPTVQALGTLPHWKMELRKELKTSQVLAPLITLGVVAEEETVG